MNCYGKCGTGAKVKIICEIFYLSIQKRARNGSSYE